MEELTKLVSNINSFIWGMYCLIPLLCGVGIYFTIRLKFIQIRKFGQAVRMLFGDLSLKGKRADKHGMSSFQSVATAIAAQVGTGNLAGAATAIAMGGPGAIFWMWIAAFFGMATIFAEAVLAQVYRTRDDAGHITGGPAYYISKGLGSHKLAVFFSVSIIIALGCIGNMVQSNSIADAFKTAFDVPPLVMGLIIAACGAFVFFGGIGRIAAVTEKMVPLMALLYVIGGLFVAEALSVMIQVFYYKKTHKRIFLMAPLHHHFEKKGWSETKVVVRFWIVSGVLAALGFAVYFAETLMAVA